MIDWHPIETAPKDGTRILVSNGVYFSAAQFAFRVEQDWKYLGFDEGVTGPYGPRMGPRFLEKVPNPDAGKRHEWWQLDNPVAFKSGDETSPDIDLLHVCWEPTHWAPLLEPPIAA